MRVADRTPVVEVSNLRKEYGDVVAVDDVSLEIYEEEIFGLVGPNGAGKTTMVEMLECLRTPTEGTASILGHDVATAQRAIKARIGVVPQSFHTFERLTVGENVSLVRQLYDQGRDVDDLLAELDLAEWEDTRFADLSGGLQRRTGIAMAVVSDPDLLFLDEPTTGLDPAARRGTWHQIEDLADRGTTVILTTHYMEEVEQLADRAALLVDGALEAVDTISGLIETYGGDVKLVVGASERGPAAESASPAEIEAVLDERASEVYRSETDDIVGLFESRSDAQAAFGDVDDLVGDRDIQLTTAGMEDVFLRLAGGTLDPGGELT